MIIRIIPDDEYSTEDFWNDLDERFPQEAESLRNNDEVYVSKTKAEEIEEWCEQHKDWGEGPEYAQDQLLFQETDNNILFYSNDSEKTFAACQDCAEVLYDNPGLYRYEIVGETEKPCECDACK